MKGFRNFNEFVNETISTVTAPVYGESPEEFPEIALESDKVTAKTHMNELAKILKELYSTALSCECDATKIKETLSPKYKHTKVKMNITEDGEFRFDSFGRHPNITINLKNMKKGNHTNETIKEEIKKQIKHVQERMPGMPSQSQISSFSSAPN